MFFKWFDFMSKFVKYNKCSVLDLSHIITSVVFCMIYVLCVRVHWFGWFTRTQICMTCLTEVLQCKGGLWGHCLCPRRSKCLKKHTSSMVFFWGGFREGRCDLSSGLSQPGGKSCWAVWRSGLWYSGTVYLRVGAGRDCGRGGWGPPRYFLLCWSIV